MESKATADNKQVYGSGFQPSPKSPSATSDTRKTLYDILKKRNRGGEICHQEKEK